MKTVTKIMLLIGILFLVLGATICNIAYGRGERFSARLKTKSGSVQAGYTLCSDGEERFDAAGIERLSIDWVSGSVRIEPHDGGEILVREKADGSLEENERLRWRLRGGELSILSFGESFNFLGQLPDKELTVLVPESFLPREIELDSASAEFAVRALSVKDTFTVDTASGDVRIEDLRCAALDIDSASGSITADDLICREVETDTASGDVSLSFAEAPRSIDADSMSGDVTLVFPKGTGLKLDFDTASGKLYGDYESGALSLSVDTASGDLTIEYR